MTEKGLTEGKFQQEENNVVAVRNVTKIERQGGLAFNECKVHMENFSSRL